MRDCSKNGPHSGGILWILSLCRSGGRKKRRRLLSRNSESRVAQSVLGPAKSGNQRGELWEVLFAQRRKLQSKSGSRSSVEYDRVRADLSFGNQKIEASDVAGSLRLLRLDKQSAHAHVADLRNVVATLAPPVHPYVTGCLHTRGKSPGWGAGGAHSLLRSSGVNSGCILAVSMHRLHENG